MISPSLGFALFMSIWCAKLETKIFFEKISESYVCPTMWDMKNWFVVGTGIFTHKREI